MSELPQTLVYSSPYVVLMYLLFMLLSKALDRLNRESRRPPGTGQEPSGSQPPAETKTPPAEAPEEP
jgi:hypothetical protein